MGKKTMRNENGLNQNEEEKKEFRKKIGLN